MNEIPTPDLFHLKQSGCQEIEYLVDSSSGTEPVYTKESALTLAAIHPIIIHSEGKQIISGLRTFQIATRILPHNSKLRVGFYSSDRDSSELLKTNTLLSLMLTTISNPQPTIFSLIKRTPKQELENISIPLSGTISKIKKTLKASEPTLRKKTNKG